MGHPGETDAHFAETYDFVERMRFDRLGVFTYSHEDDTHSFSMADDVPADVKQERADELMDLQQGISHELNQRKVGQTFKVLFDRKEGGYLIGRTEADSPEVDNEVLIPAIGSAVGDSASQTVRLGNFANVRIDRAEEFDLYGEVV